MKKKLIVTISVLAVFVLSIAAVALSRTAPSFATAESCCAGGSCPMKKNKAESAKKESCCDKCDCCGEGKAKAESCPMMKKNSDEQSAGAATEVNSQNVVVVKGESCCSCSCCGGAKKSSNSI